MRLEPVEDWITGIAMLHQKSSPIINPDAAKGTSRCFLIEAVGPKAAEAGYSRGDIVVAKSVFDLLFYGGAYHRVTFVKDSMEKRLRTVSTSRVARLRRNDDAQSDASR
ncbi:hypothetical protein LCGC14_1528060 [marine sediment metagenome]|uniref:Uncharacterized protein n=1 Tax=marine sediment metagenome TaxID=412755 RepID=A0A0F9IX39_9ZZZZ